MHFTEDIENSTIDPLDVVTTLGREIFLSGYYKAFGLSAGHCRLCEECPLSECRHAEVA